jgi:hypothetical protein
VSVFWHKEITTMLSAAAANLEVLQQFGQHRGRDKPPLTGGNRNHEMPFLSGPGSYEGLRMVILVTITGVTGGMEIKTERK